MLYDDFLPPPLVAALQRDCQPVEGIDGLSINPDLIADFPDIENPEILQAVVDVVREMHPHLQRVLEQRRADRIFVDEHFLQTDGTDVIGKTDAEGRIVIGPALASTQMRSVEVPAFMVGPQVTLF